jgi:hypothetical protein
MPLTASTKAKLSISFFPIVIRGSMKISPFAFLRILLLRQSILSRKRFRAVQFTLQSSPSSMFPIDDKAGQLSPYANSTPDREFLTAQLKGQESTRAIIRLHGGAFAWSCHNR